jgi:hypothetical protein
LPVRVVEKNLCAPSLCPSNFLPRVQRVFVFYYKAGLGVKK